MEKYILTKHEANARGKVISNILYDVIVSLGVLDEFAGILVLTFEVSELVPLWLDYKGKSVSQLSINSGSELVEYRDNRIYLNNLVLGLNEVRVEFRNSYSRDGSGLHQINDPVDGAVYLYSQFEPFAANRFLPCFDQPDLKAVLKLTVAAPADWVVVSNSTIAARYSSQDYTKEIIHAVGAAFPMSVHEFKPTPTISTYLFALCAGPFSTTALAWEIPLGLYWRKSIQEPLNCKSFFEWTIKGFEFYNAFFDYKYPFEKYDQVFVPEFNFVAMENVACVVYDEKFVYSEGSKLIRACNIFMHEMSHMWFGNLVTMKWWDDIWLNESFATFISSYCMHVQMPDLFPDVWSYFYVKQRKGMKLDQLVTTHPIRNEISHTVEIFSFFDEITYEKGSAVLKQLFFVMGRDAFRDSIRQYFKAFEYKSAEFQDLIKIMSEAVGSTDVALWSELWIQKAGLNVLTPQVTRNSDLEILAFEVLQTPAVDDYPVLRPHRLGVAVYDDNMDLKIEVIDVLAAAATSVNIKGKYFILNCQNDSYCKTRLDNQSLEFIISNFNKVKSELHRLVVYGTLSDMLEDKLVTFDYFLGFTKLRIAEETHMFNTKFLVKACYQSLVYYYHDPCYVMRVCHDLFGSLMDKMSTLPGPDLKRLIIMVLYDPEDIIKCLDWLEDLDLATSLKWKILQKYSGFTQDAQALIEKQTDNSLSAKISKGYCKAAYPSPKTKEKTFQVLVNGAKGLSRFERVSVMKGFSLQHQKDLLKPYGKRYFNQVLRIIDLMDLEYSIDFVTFMFPLYLSIPELVDSINSVLLDIPSHRNDLIRFFNEQLDLLRGKII